MSEFLETLKRGLQESQQKFAVVQQRMGVMQAEFQAAAQELNAWQTLLKSQTAKEQTEAGVVGPMLPAPENINAKSEGNKTAAVRELLQQSPLGVTPGEMWKQLQSRISNRVYLYSILKRLKDRGDVREKRGKYYLNVKAEEHQVIQ